jgi:hypothetical protein
MKGMTIVEERREEGRKNGSFCRGSQMIYELLITRHGQQIDVSKSFLFLSMEEIYFFRLRVSQASSDIPFLLPRYLRNECVKL